MSMRNRPFALVSALAVTSALVFTADAQAGISARQRRQQARIAQGVRSSELTPSEAARLEAQQRRIRREERRYHADGVLGPWERADLNRDLNRASRDVYRQKHDGQTR
jgi:hypothetical protein